MAWVMTIRRVNDSPTRTVVSRGMRYGGAAVAAPETQSESHAETAMAIAVAENQVRMLGQQQRIDIQP